MTALSNLTVLIVEDGDEYLETLSRHVQGPRYLQAHDGEEAVRHLSAGGVDIIYLDMRFDRVPSDRLLGDRELLSSKFLGDSGRVERYLQNNQGLLILTHLEEAGYAEVPVVLAYDFSRESKRLERLTQAHPQLHWVRDTIGADEIAALLARLGKP